MKNKDGNLYIKSLPNGKYRESTHAEIDLAKLTDIEIEELKSKIDILNKELKQLKSSCTHDVCVDEPGCIYHTRTCVACGEEWLI